jgi:hypothetical protein
MKNNEQIGKNSVRTRKHVGPIGHRRPTHTLTIVNTLTMAKMNGMSEAVSMKDNLVSAELPFLYWLVTPT